MLASLNGTLEALGTDWAIIKVGGIGFKVYLPTSALSQLGSPGDAVKVFTHLYVREDNISLYGATSTEELGLFETLIGVSGLGPRLALAMLGAMDAEKLAAAIATANNLVLTQVPGIGKKMAERILLELKDKVGTGLGGDTLPETRAENAEALAALLSLGYSSVEANEAIASLPTDIDSNLEDRVRLALSYLAHL